MRNELDWKLTVMTLDAVSAEIRAIHETPAKDQTPEQLAALHSLRKQAQAIGQQRYALLQASANRPAMPSIKGLPASLKGHSITVGSIKVGQLPEGEAVEVFQVSQRNGDCLWKVVYNGRCASYLANDLALFDMSYEPMPSSRTEAWLAQYRVPSLEEALLLACYVADRVVVEYLEAIEPIIASKVKAKTWGGRG